MTKEKKSIKQNIFDCDKTELMGGSDECVCLVWCSAAIWCHVLLRKPSIVYFQTKCLSPKYQVEPLSKSLHPTIFHLHKEILWKKNINYSFQWIRHCFLLVTEFDRLLSRCFESIRHTTERQRLGGGGRVVSQTQFLVIRPPTSIY